MFEYKNPLEIEKSAQMKDLIIKNLEQENTGLKTMILDHQTNLKLNKEAIADLLATIKKDSEVNKKHARRGSWFSSGTKGSAPTEKTHLVNTINKFVSENLNLQNEVFRIQEIVGNSLQENSELRYQLAVLRERTESLSKKDACVQTSQKLTAPIQRQPLDPSPQNFYILRLKKKIRHYMELIKKYRGFLDELRHDYSMPSELIGNIEDMQVDDSFQLMSSYVESNLDVDSGLYDNTFNQDSKIENTFDLLECEYSKELKYIKEDISGNTTKKPQSNINKRMEDMQSHKTNSYFNYIKKVDVNKHRDSRGFPNASFGKSSRINDSESFHYDPRDEDKSNIRASKLGTNFQNEQDENERSLILPQFDTFSACPQIHKSDEFKKSQKTIRAFEEEAQKEAQIMAQERMTFGDDKIEVVKDIQVPKDNSLMDSFLLEITSKKPDWKSDEVKAKKAPARKYRNMYLKLAKGKKLKLPRKQD
ncbi:unnamed protein product [Moneuplotes crassus]|uniref:Uncharacterized protein n=1 Tax=Euplotes crassus TaxID=5936 RepID=A0AAD1UK16_EUPCR|nr:unnamed protein product [Moneuplotes crassus]